MNSEKRTASPRKKKSYPVLTNANWDFQKAGLADIQVSSVQLYFVTCSQGQYIFRDVIMPALNSDSMYFSNDQVVICQP